MVDPRAIQPITWRALVGYTITSISDSMAALKAEHSLTGTAWRLTGETLLLFVIYGVLRAVCSMWVAGPFASVAPFICYLLPVLYRTAVTNDSALQRAAAFWNGERITPIQARKTAEGRFKVLVAKDWAALLGLAAPLVVIVLSGLTVTPGHVAVQLKNIQLAGFLFVYSVLLIVFTKVTTENTTASDATRRTVDAYKNLWCTVVLAVLGLIVVGFIYSLLLAGLLLINLFSAEGFTVVKLLIDCSVIFAAGLNIRYLLFFVPLAVARLAMLCDPPSILSSSIPVD